MPFPFITSVTSPSVDFPFKKGDTIRISNPDGTLDTITLVVDRTKVSRTGRGNPPLFLASTSRGYPDSNKRQIGTPWTF